MFPNFRLVIGAIFASVVALSCGFGMFAAFRVNHAPLSRLASGVAPPQFIAGAAPPAAGALAVDNPSGHRVLSNETQIALAAAKPLTPNLDSPTDAITPAVVVTAPLQPDAVGDRVPPLASAPLASAPQSIVASDGNAQPAAAPQQRATAAADTSAQTPMTPALSADSSSPDAPAGHTDASAQSSPGPAADAPSPLRSASVAIDPPQQPPVAVAIAGAGAPVNPVSAIATDAPFQPPPSAAMPNGDTNESDATTGAISPAPAFEPAAIDDVAKLSRHGKQNMLRKRVAARRALKARHKIARRIVVRRRIAAAPRRRIAPPPAFATAPAQYPTYSYARPNYQFASRPTPGTAPQPVQRRVLLQRRPVTARPVIMRRAPAKRTVRGGPFARARIQ